MPNPSRASLAMTHYKPHLPPPRASPTPSPEPTKAMAPSPSPVSVSEYLDSVSVGGGGGCGDDVRPDRGGVGGGGVRVEEEEEGLGWRGLDGGSRGDLEGSVSEIGTLSGQGRSICEMERRLAVRATLDSLWGTGRFDPVVVDEGDFLGELLEGEEGEEQMERGRGERLEVVRGVEVDKRNVTEGDGGKARASMPKHESGGVSSFRSSEQARRNRGRHHCLLDGHFFKERGVEAIGEGGYKQKTKNKIEERFVKCWGCSEKIAEEQSWVCEVEVCGMVACRGCMRRWEKERKKRVLAGQKGVMEWLGS